MPNLMIKHFGALGDQCFTVPVIDELRTRFDNIWMFTYKSTQGAFLNTRLVDKYIIQPSSDFHRQLREEYGVEEARRQYGYWLMTQLGDIKIDASIDFMGVLAGKYAFHEGLDPKAKWSKQRKIDNAKGVNWFDEFTRRAAEELDMPDLMDVCKGKRPTTRHSTGEQAWLKGFRKAHGIPKGAFMLGWQLTGSGMYKDYPYFDKVIVALKRKYPFLYLVTTGLKGTEKLGEGRKFGSWLNLAGKVSFRQAYLLSSIYDCFVGADTGVTMFAMGYETPKVMLSSHTPGDHNTWPETRVIEPECDCAPCYVIRTIDCEGCPKAPGGWPMCIDISPDLVTDVISNIIDEWRDSYGS